MLPVSGPSALAEDQRAGHNRAEGGLGALSRPQLRRQKGWTVTLGELILNVAVLFVVLHRNVGVHAVTRRRFTVPVVIIAVVGMVFLRHVPTQGNDATFEILGLAAGVLLGVTAGLLLRLERNSSGHLQTRAGTVFAGLWIVIIAGRVAFSEGATHLYARQVADWSRTNQITGSDAFTAMFVLMALAMIGGMTATLALHAAHPGRTSMTPRTAVVPA
jgi:hypothetical protein